MPNIRYPEFWASCDPYDAFMSEDEKVEYETKYLTKEQLDAARRKLADWHEESTKR